MKVRVLQHAVQDRLGCIQPWLEDRGYEIQTTRLHRGEPLPSGDDYDWLLILGGPMGAYEDDEYPWMKPEKQMIRRAIRGEKKVLGLCLGAQMIASALGANVYPQGRQEIGWYPVRLTEQARGHPWMRGVAGEFTVLHWHGDTFELPEGAIRLASSELCRNQGFIYGDNVLAIQFHPEVTREGLETFLEVHRGQMPEGEHVQSPRTLLERANFEQTNPIMHRMLDQFDRRRKGVEKESG